jgi:mRNA interferase YafQ
MLKETKSNRFDRDVLKQIKRGKNIDNLVFITELITQEKWGVAERKKYRDHPLSGNWEGFRECHVAPDWLLIYQINRNEVFYVRTGTHADLFK